MARQRDPRRDEAFEIWKSTNGEKPLKDIAVELDCSPSQIRKWKSQDNWEGNSNVTNEKRSVTKHGKRKEQKKRSGNPNPKNQFGERNTAALKHGIFSKYLPQETLDIINEMQDKTPADLLYDQIQIQYATIIRSQKIMWVENKDDLAKEQSQFGFGDSGADKYEIQFAWDRQATFIASQSRAMGTLSNLIKQFCNIAHEDDERRLKIEQMQLGMEKTKREIERIGGEGEADLVDDWVAAMGEVDE
jgi:uncharacterized protein YjcR